MNYLHFNAIIEIAGVVIVIAIVFGFNFIAGTSQQCQAAFFNIGFSSANPIAFEYSQATIACFINYSAIAAKVNWHCCCLEQC